MSQSYYRRKRQQQQMLEMQAMTNPNIFFFKGNSFNLEMKLNEVESNPDSTINDAYIVVVGKLIKFCIYILKQRIFCNLQAFFLLNKIQNIKTLSKIKNQQKELLNYFFVPNFKILSNLLMILQILQQNMVCLIFTIVLGMCLLFPLIFMCCGWWRSMVYPAYEISITTYKKLSAIINNPAIRTLHLQICDNGFNKQKTKLLYNMLSTSQIKSFNFSNSASDSNYKQNQYQNFVQNMKPIKMLPMQATIRWWTQYVL